MTRHNWIKCYLILRRKVCLSEVCGLKWLVLLCGCHLTWLNLTRKQVKITKSSCKPCPILWYTQSFHVSTHFLTFQPQVLATYCTVGITIKNTDPAYLHCLQSHKLSHCFILIAFPSSATLPSDVDSFSIPLLILSSTRNHLHMHGPHYFNI